MVFIAQLKTFNGFNSGTVGSHGAYLYTPQV